MPKSTWRMASSGLPSGGKLVGGLSARHSHNNHLKHRTCTAGCWPSNFCRSAVCIRAIAFQVSPAFPLAKNRSKTFYLVSERLTNVLHGFKNWIFLSTRQTSGVVVIPRYSDSFVLSEHAWSAQTHPSLCMAFVSMSRTCVQECDDSLAALPISLQYCKYLQ
jgi:hypothetical protein